MRQDAAARAIIWIAIVLRATASAVAAQPVTVQPVTAEDSVRAMLADFARTGEGGDLGALVRFYDDSPTLRWVERGAVTLRSLDDLRRYLAQVPAGTALRTRFDSLELSVLASGVVSGTARTRTTFLGGSPAQPLGGFDTRLTFVVVRRASGWKFVQGHAASPP